METRAKEAKVKNRSKHQSQTSAPAPLIEKTTPIGTTTNATTTTTRTKSAETKELQESHFLIINTTNYIIRSNHITTFSVKLLFSPFVQDRHFLGFFVYYHLLLTVCDALFAFLPLVGHLSLKISDSPQLLEIIYMVFLIVPLLQKSMFTHCFKVFCTVLFVFSYCYLLVFCKNDTCFGYDQFWAMLITIIIICLIL